ncbi:MAG: hypothetical protein GY841_16930 [FCB group bacterium]|nr:hypothetical protein [FCB group bacterium]
MIFRSVITHAYVFLMIIMASTMTNAAMTPPSHPLFDSDEVHEIHLTFHQADWWDQLTYNYEHYEDIPYIAAEFDWESTHFDSIGVRFKGNSSYMSYSGYKKSFKLDIDEYVLDQVLDGLDKLNLNNCFLDPSYVREKCAYELCEAVGLPSCRTNYVALYINGTFWGLYLMIEQFDQEFIESRFGAGEEGNLWKGEPHGSQEYLGAAESYYYDDYELKTNEELNDWSSLVTFTDALNNTSLSVLPDTMHVLLDVNSAMAMLAIENFTVNLDSYIGRCVNHYFYNRQLDGRMVFAKWDQNEAWGIFNMYNLSSTQMKQLSPYWTSTAYGEERPLAERLWQIEAYDDVYLGHMRKLMAGVAQPDTLLNRMEELRDLIRPYVYNELYCMFSTAEFEIALSSDIYASGGPPPGRLIPGLDSFIRTRDSYLSGLIGSWTPIEGLVINELMAGNSSAVADEHGDYDDWIEVANVGSASINLSGLILTDHWEGNPDFVFPDTTLNPGEYIVVWADEEPLEGDLHAPFQLDSDGEDVYLVDGDVIIDQITFPTIPSNISYGRWANGSGAWQMLSVETPGAENQNPEEPEEVILFINEFMAINDSVIQDETGTYEDWVEIYNPGPDPVEMGGLFLTDELTNTTQWSFPDTTLAAGGFLLVWCDNDEEDGPLHTNFKLNGDGEEIGLFNRLTAGNGEIDSYAFGVQTTDTSEGRQSDGGEPWVFYDDPTPGASNSGTTNSPPQFNWTTFTPTSVTDTDPVLVLTDVTDGSAVTNVTLYYDAGSGYSSLTMYDDGSHEDSLAGDDIYGATIPAQSDGATVDFYIAATDDSSVVSYDPFGAPTTTYDYEVGSTPIFLYINEIMAVNETTIEDPDESDEYPDWIEIYNAGGSTVDMSGMYLTDDLYNPILWQIPEGVSIGAGEYLLFWADDDESQGSTHTNFKLSADGESVGLFDTDAHGRVVLDSKSFGTQTADVSYGRLPDGTDNWTDLSEPTPGESNIGLMCGDANSDQSINVGDAVFLINYIFKSGTAPDPLCRGEANGDTSINVGDAVYLINYVFKGGAAPMEPCCP